MAKREGLADAVPTWFSMSSKRRSSVSSFSFNDANLLFVVASEMSSKKIKESATLLNQLKKKKKKIPFQQIQHDYRIGQGNRRGGEH